jgi:hypothetical protein
MGPEGSLPCSQKLDTGHYTEPYKSSPIPSHFFKTHFNIMFPSATMSPFKYLRKLSLCLTKHHPMKTYWGMEVWFHAFVASALDGGVWSASRPSRFTPRKRLLGTHWIGGWVGPRVVLDAVLKRQIPSPRRESNPST